MNRQEVIAGIGKSWTIASAINLAEVFSNPTPIVPSEEFRHLSMSTETSYEELYLCGLRKQDYNFTLSDISFFQFGLTKDFHVRFAYYPNPLLGTSREATSEIGEMAEFVSEGVLSVEEYLQQLSEVRKSQHPPLTRYENAPEDYTEFTHPCSHFHMGHHNDNRWPVSRIISPVAFSLLVFRQYYSEFWYAKHRHQLFGETITLDNLLIKEKFDCRVLSEEWFSLEEKQSFYFA